MPTFENFHSVTVEGSKKGKDFGFHYLSTVAREDFNQAIQQYNNAEFFGLALSGRKKEAYEAAYNKAIATNNKEAEKKILRDFARDEEIAFNFLTHQEYNKFLGDNEVWSQWINEASNPLARARIRYLRECWLRHNKFSHYTSDALLFASQLLGAMEKHIVAAKQEWNEKRYRLPRDERKKYHIYLDNTWKQISREKQTLCWAMYARLEAACQSGDVSCDDVTTTLKFNLSKLGIHLEEKFRANSPKPILRKNEVLDKNEEKETKMLSQEPHLENSKKEIQTHIQKGSLISSRSMESQTAATFYQYIEDNGVDGKGSDLEVKKELKSLKWFDSGNNLPLTVVRSKNQCYFIPAALKKLIPTKSRKPEWLFQGRNKRFRYFQDQSQFLQNISSLSNLNIVISDRGNLSGDPIWSKLESMLTHAKQKAEEARSQFVSKRWLAIFQHETRNFYRQWEGELLKQQQLILYRQIEFLSLLLPNGQPVEHLIGEGYYFPDKTRLDILHMLDAVEKDIKDLCNQLKKREINYQKPLIETINQEQPEKQNELLREFKKIDERLINLIEADQKNLAKPNVENVFNQLANDSCSVSQDKIEQVMKFYSELKNTEQKFYFSRENENNFKQIQSQLENVLKTCHQNLRKEHVEQAMQRANQYAYVLDKLALLINNQSLCQTIEQFLANHKKFAESESFEGKIDIMKQMNDLMATVFVIMSHKGIKIEEFQEQLFFIDCKYNKEKSSNGTYQLQNTEKPSPIIQAEKDLEYAQEELIKSQKMRKEAEESYVSLMKRLDEQREKGEIIRSSLQDELATSKAYLEGHAIIHRHQGSKETEPNYQPQMI